MTAMSVHPKESWSTAIRIGLGVIALNVKCFFLVALCMIPVVYFLSTPHL